MCLGKGLTEGSRTESCISRLDRGGKVRSERSVKLKASVVAAVFRRSTVSLCLFYVFQPLMGSREAQKENAKAHDTFFIMFLLQQQKLPPT